MIAHGRTVASQKRKRHSLKVITKRQLGPVPRSRVVEFIDDRRLGPAFRLFNRHRIVDEKGKVRSCLGAKQLRLRRERLL